MMITVSREFGAGGSLLAARVAETLGWKLVDNQLVDEVARRAGLSADVVKEREERGPTFVDRLARALAAGSPELLGRASEVPELAEARQRRITEQVVADLASDHVVLVGRAASAVIGRQQDALHVKLVAAVEFRVQVVADRFGIPPDEARRQIRDVDAHRARYHRQYYHRDWNDPCHYHLVLNVGWLGLDRAAQLVVDAVNR